MGKMTLKIIYIKLYIKRLEEKKRKDIIPLPILAKTDPLNFWKTL